MIVAAQEPGGFIATDLAVTIHDRLVEILEPTGATPLTSESPATRGCVDTRI
jgi:hypothetical protein